MQCRCAPALILPPVLLLGTWRGADGEPEFTIGDNLVLNPVYKNEITWNG